MCCGTEAGSYFRRIDSCITQLKGQGPSRTCIESNEDISRLSGRVHDRERVAPSGVEHWLGAVGVQVPGNQRQSAQVREPTLHSNRANAPQSPQSQSQRCTVSSSQIECETRSRSCTSVTYMTASESRRPPSGALALRSSGPGTWTPKSAQVS